MQSSYAAAASEDYFTPMWKLLLRDSKIISMTGKWATLETA
jgi:hypothetical protein